MAGSEDSEERRRAFAKEQHSRKQSMAYVLGTELKLVQKDSARGNCIAVFTSGGDAQGRLSKAVL